MNWGRAAQSLWFARWWNSAVALFGGSKLHPSAALFGKRGQVQISRRASVGARTRLEVNKSGRIILAANVWLSSDIEIQTETMVYIGIGTTIQRRSTINGSTRIGSGCILAPNVFISSGTHPFRTFPHLPIREQERRLNANSGPSKHMDRAVWIQDDCWLGTNSVVSPGVTIGKGSVIGANAVVTHDMAPYSIVAGAPAKVIGHRLKWSPNALIDPSDERHWPYILSGSVSVGGNAKQKCIELTHDVPVQIVLSPVGRADKVTFHVEARSPVEVESPVGVFEVGQGVSTIEIPAESLVGQDGYIYCDVRMRGSKLLDSIRISLIELSGSYVDDSENTADDS